MWPSIFFYQNQFIDECPRKKKTSCSHGVFLWDTEELIFLKPYREKENTEN